MLLKDVSVFPQYSSSEAHLTGNQEDRNTRDELQSHKGSHSLFTEKHYIYFLCRLRLYIIATTIHSLPLLGLTSMSTFLPGSITLPGKVSFKETASPPRCIVSSCVNMCVSKGSTCVL